MRDAAMGLRPAGRVVQEFLDLGKLDRVELPAGLGVVQHVPPGTQMVQLDVEVRQDALAVGINAVMTLFRISKFTRSDRQYRTTTERMAPSWMAISKLFRKSVWLRWRRRLVRMRWPVEDMGRNSETPSIIPRMRASK